MDHQSYNQGTIAQWKRCVLSRKPLPAEPSSRFERELIESWRYAKGKGLNASLTKFPASIIDFSTKDRLTEFMLYEWGQRAAYYLAKHEVLASNGAAIYYIDQQRCVYSKGGNPTLIQELKQIGIKFGANLSDEYIGTTGLSFTNNEIPTTYILGEMHYMQALVPYVTVSMAFDFSNLTNMRQMVIFPLEKYSPQMMAVINAVYYLEKYHSSAIDADIVQMKTAAIDLASQDNAILLTDENGRIVDANSAFYHMFQVTCAELVGRRLDVAIPRMRDALLFLKIGRQSRFIVSIKGVSSVVDCTPVIQDGNTLGMIIQLQNHKESLPVTNKPPKRTRYSFDSMVGESDIFLKVKAKAMLVAQSPSNIMICGESGTGKELFAQSIHDASPRRTNPFIAINCAAIPKDLIVSELFGHEEGAFTGAKRTGTAGKFELADGGTLFLDEITEMPLDMQAVLLRVLESGEVTRLGGSKNIEVDVRIITATNRNIEDCIKNGSFRNDLYYRLNVIKLDLPPLRERREDILLAIQFHLDYFVKILKKPALTLSQDAVGAMIQYDWPGNMRQLRNAIETAVNFAQNNQITLDVLPDSITRSYSAAEAEISVAAQAHPTLVQDNMIDVEPESPSEAQEPPPLNVQINELMVKYNGNKSKVALEAGISRTKLYRILEDQADEIFVAQSDSLSFQPTTLNSYNNYEDFEHATIKALMVKHRGNKTKIAKEMGIAKSTLYRKMAYYDVK